MPTLRFLIYWGLRADSLCDPDARSTCPDSERVEIEDPETGARRTVYEPCPDCPRERLEQTTEQTGAGQLLQRILDLDWALETGFGVTWDDVPVDEYYGLRLLRSERARKEREDNPRRHG